MPLPRRHASDPLRPCRLFRLPKGYRFVPARPDTILRPGHWWRDGGIYVRVWPDEYGTAQREASKTYDAPATAGRLVPV